MCVRTQPSESEGVSKVFSDKKPRWVARQENGHPFQVKSFSSQDTEAKKPAHASRLSQALLVIQKTTQPGHVIVVAAVLVLSAIFYPSKTDASHGTRLRQLLSLLHLTAFAIQFGSQIWMTFVSGLSLYFTMPRHIFGQIQKVLFPLYFTLTGILSLISLYTYSKLHSLKDGEGKSQVIAMCTCFAVQLLTRLYLCPRLVRFMECKHKMEQLASPTAIAKCPRYMQYCVYFRWAHTATAMCNIFSMACTTFHLHHLAQQLCI